MLSLLVSLLALAGAPALHIPYGQPGRSEVGPGPSALWQGRANAWFVIHTLSDLAKGTGTLQRARFDANREWGGPPQWDAGQLLVATPPNKRRIFTHDPSMASGSLAAPFEWPYMPPVLRSLLDADGQGEARTSYLRGVRERELGQPHGLFRPRAGVLGDIVRSVPLIVGAPATGASEAQRQFARSHAGREMAVYVGANDGMFHAFSATSGEELFAYIPGALHRKLPSLSDPAYQRRPWVDGSASQRDLEVAGRWRTVLASGMGTGARGLFLLDVTEPARFGQDGGVLAEFTEHDDTAVGHLHAPPLLAQLGLTGQGEPDERWSRRPVAIFSSGINPAAQGPGALFVLALDKAPATPWQLESNYLRIDTGGEGNMLSPAALVLGAGGHAVHAYAGDLDGKLWHFDLGRKKSRLVFTARDAEGNAQPIAHAPHVVHAPGGGYVVIVGTGKLLEDTDLLRASFSTQSLYAIVDTPSDEADPVSSRALLAERILSGSSSYDIVGEELDYYEARRKRGWYFDLPGSRSEGERAAASPVSADGALVFQTVLPGSPTPEKGRLYLVGTLTGKTVEPVATAKRPSRTGERIRGTPLQSLILITGGGDAGARSPTGLITAVRKVTLFRPEPGGPGPPLEIEVRHAAGRLGWREISNWQDLREAALKQGG
ncbi:hypothetical protein KY495_01190 [Massilia sp. PAMC28688]|uniref:pilus assembly protein n=1 Tax=Massilia sp. PAMC28688 TaxID=2861283 RepID=UPI001C62D66E|nr:PilC/PilY family type IV pilus protein [Massilia sp. PAMC28688]QYF93887.1 hypothetical protein KY495_01190 [Massilia sp. PAMC28688]